jgi:hypothetical protein
MSNVTAVNRRRPKDDMAYLLICFVLGVGNFAMHKAVVESGHPFVEDTKLYFGRHFGRHGSYAIEFVILASAMIFATSGSLIVVLFYTGYTLLNMLAAYLLLSGKV